MLVKATLVTQLTPVFTAGLLPTSTRAEQARRIANAYNTYGMLAQSCAVLPPSLVNLPTLKTQLETAMKTWYIDAWPPANMWGDAFQAYWTGALFGATGAVLATPGTPALKTALYEIFSRRVYITHPAAIDKIATALDTFTRTVVVKDTALPVPPGCQAPII